MRWPWNIAEFIMMVQSTGRNCWTIVYKWKQRTSVGREEIMTYVGCSVASYVMISSVNIATWCDPESTQRVCREKSWFCNSACRSSWSKFHPVEYQNVFKSSKHIQYECSYLYPCHCPLLRAQLEHCTLYVRLRRTLISLENDTWTTNDSYWIALWE